MILRRGIGPRGAPLPMVLPAIPPYDVGAIVHLLEYFCAGIEKLIEACGQRLHVERNTGGPCVCPCPPTRSHEGLVGTGIRDAEKQDPVFVVPLDPSQAFGGVFDLGPGRPRGRRRRRTLIRLSPKYPAPRVVFPLPSFRPVRSFRTSREVGRDGKISRERS